MVTDSLNIRIEKDNYRYIASTAEFPGCIGIGNTEKIALEDLGKSVTAHLEKQMKNVLRLVKNPKIVRVENSNELSNKLKFLDKIFYLLGISRKARKDILKMFVNVDLKVISETLSPYALEKVASNVKIRDDLLDTSADLDSILVDNGGFIISMPLNFN